jgi:hypothetical protein
VRFFVGLSMLVVTFGVLSAALNWRHPALLALTAVGVVCALLPLPLFRWVVRRGLTADPALGEASREARRA